MSCRAKPRVTGVPERPAQSGACATRSTEAAFVAIGAEPIDAPMWPIQPATWLQPERVPSIPAWNGLGLERHNRIPTPEFLRDEFVPVNRVGALDIPDTLVDPDARPVLPDSGLAPLGWDPRTVYRKEEGE